MVPEFQTLEEVLSYRGDVRIFNLREHSAGLPEEFNEYLRPSITGLYIEGIGNFCALQFNKSYYDAAQFKDLNNLSHTFTGFSSNHGLTSVAKRKDPVIQFNLPKPLGTLDELIKAKEGVCDETGKIVLSGPMIHRYKYKFKLKDDVAESRSALTAAVISHLLGELCSHAAVNPTLMDFRPLLKPEYFTMTIDMAEITQFYKKTISALHSFIGEDLLNIYFVKNELFQIQIQKSMDYRIYEFYRKQFEAKEEN